MDPGTRWNFTKPCLISWETLHRRIQTGWEMSLFWDATGNQKYCWFSKEGFLEGFDCNPQSFDTEMMLAHKVNCWIFTSLEADIKIKYPVAYYHCATLDSADIRRQWFEVTVGLDSDTRWLCRNGNYIGWCVVQGGYTVSTSNLPRRHTPTTSPTGRVSV